MAQEYSYKAGWPVSIAQIVQASVLAVILIFVGYLLYPGFRRVTLEKWRQIKEKCLRMGNSLVGKANE